MARWHCFLAALLALEALCSGCAANRPANPFGSASSNSSAALAKKTAKKDSATAGDKNNSQDRSAALAAVNGSKSSGTDDDDSRADRRRGDSPGSQTAKALSDKAHSDKDSGHDPETLAYINQQLRDATPEERTALLAELNGLHPEAVRQILRGRRMALTPPVRVPL